tara:strand:- start:19 stop:936 length:918 start_codon:yes stop_codon:yes gene_type:complete
MNLYFAFINELSFVGRGLIMKLKQFNIILFCIFGSLYFVGLWGILLNNFQEALTSKADFPIHINTFQYWFFGVFGILYESVFLALFVGIFAYHFRKTSWNHSVIFGLFLKYFHLIIFLIISGNSLSSIKNGLADIANIRDYVMILLNFILAILVAYIAYLYAKEIEPFNEQDRDFYFIAGISKKIWVLLIISFYPIVLFLTKYTIVILYDLSANISSWGNWKDAFSLSSLISHDSSDSGLILPFIKISSVFFLWAMALFVFIYGVETIQKKERRYRKLKMALVYVILPGLILFIPIIRNRTWFFF